MVSRLGLNKDLGWDRSCFETVRSLAAARCPLKWQWAHKTAEYSRCGQQELLTLLQHSDVTHFYQKSLVLDQNYVANHVSVREGVLVRLMIHGDWTARSPVFLTRFAGSRRFIG